jgi:hypothetical protein
MLPLLVSLKKSREEKLQAYVRKAHGSNVRNGQDKGHIIEDIIAMDTFFCVQSKNKNTFLQIFVETKLIWCSLSLSALGDRPNARRFKQALIRNTLSVVWRLAH